MTWRPPEQAALDAAEPLLAAIDSTATISTGKPSDWTPSSPPHVQVFQSTNSRDAGQASAEETTVQFTIWAEDTYVAQQLARQLMRALVDLKTTPTISRISYQLGVLPDVEVETGAPMATFSLSLRIRTNTMEA